MLTPPPTSRTKERILAFGSYGSGKSAGWAALRDMYLKTDTPGHFHIISTEWEMAHRTAEGYPADEFDKNATIHEATDYDSIESICLAIAANAGPSDWLVVDSIGNIWSWAQDAYCQHRWGKSFKDYMAGGGKVQEINWSQVNASYRNIMNPYIVRFPGHKYACAQADTVQMEGGWKDSKEVQEMFGRLGVKPVGQKELGYAFHSVLLFTHPSRDEYKITTVDDPSREKLNGAVVAPLPIGFVGTYLLGVAGWTL